MEIKGPRYEDNLQLRTSYLEPNGVGVKRFNDSTIQRFNSFFESERAERLKAIKQERPLAPVRVTRDAGREDQL
jgi:hypothetical protein